MCKFVCAAEKLRQIVGGMSTREQRLFLTVLFVPKQKRDIRDGHSDMTLGQAAIAESPRLVMSALFWYSVLHVCNVVMYAIMLYDLDKARRYQPAPNISSQDYIDLRTPAFYLEQESILDAITLVLFLIEGSKFLKYRTNRTATFSQRMINVAINAVYLLVGWMYLAAAHMVAFGFNYSAFRDFSHSVDATLITNVFNVKGNFSAKYGSNLMQYQWLLLLVYALLLIVFLFHILASVYDWLLQAWGQFGRSLESYIDTAQQTTLTEVEKGMVQPMQEALAKVQTKMELRLDKRGAHFLKQPEQILINEQQQMPMRNGLGGSTLNRHS